MLPELSDSGDNLQASQVVGLASSRSQLKQKYVNMQIALII